MQTSAKFFLSIGFWLLSAGRGIAQTDSVMDLSEVVLTGTRIETRKSESPVAVTVVSGQTLSRLQACNLYDGLKFQTGLRVETNCQTCNYSQLRINGLPGGYSQILINGRPLFGSLTGMYGLEQLPAAMIEKIEVVRGGGSSLYGMSAIAGTVNVFTRKPTQNEWEVSTRLQNIGSSAMDLINTMSSGWVSENKKLGGYFTLGSRNRQAFDANQDGFTELPSLENLNASLNISYDPNPRQKLAVSLNRIGEKRYGGEITGKPITEALQAESREHRISLGNADYRLRSINGFSDATIYAAFQQTSRSHFTGVFPDSLADIQNYIANPPNGEAKIGFLQGGVQFNRRFQGNGLIKHTLTLGLEWIDEFIRDEIPAYSYRIKQHIVNPSAFVQHVWKPHALLSILSGIRADKHNWIDNPVWSPRLGVLYKSSKNSQIRLGYGTGFRAPQAHDNDLHIAFAGGGVSRVQLSPLLREEQSRSFNLSWNHDKATVNHIQGFTLDAFYNRLRNPFVLENAGNDPFGEIFEKRNGQGARVQGVSAEYRFNYQKKIQIQSGFTLQQSLYDTAAMLISGQNPLRAFARTPNAFGYIYGWAELTDKINVSLDAVYTGSMYVPHFGGAENFSRDSIVVSRPFLEINTALNFKLKPLKNGIDWTLSLGVRNLLNAYQQDFDIGKNRDSNYIYGPASPRTIFIALRLGKTGR